MPCLDPELENIFYKTSLEGLPYFSIINITNYSKTIQDMYTTFYRELVDSSGCNIEFLDNENMNNLPQGYSQVVRNNTHNLGQQMFNSNLLMMVKNFSDNHENKN